MLTEIEQAILNSIVVASEDNPNKPEFPPEDPKFPATPTIPFPIDSHPNVFLKDESHNPTGTHKDRMAWEVVVTYRNMLLAKKRGQRYGELPQMSLISSGSAANAIQSMLAKYHLPDLKVIVDHNLDETIQDALRKKGCEIYPVDLSAKMLSTKDILRITKNEEGFDITSSQALDPATRFYDWLSYEILNNDPQWCFVPFGTGNLYENLLNVAKFETSQEKGDPRYQGDIGVLRRCNFMGATTNNPSSKAAEKLYSPHLPFVHFSEQWIKLYRSAGYCGDKSHVHIVKESFLDQAITLAQEREIDAEPSALAGLALFLEYKDSIPSEDTVVIVSTGRTKY